MTSQATNFYVKVSDQKLREFYKNLRSFSIAPPNLLIKFHNVVGNIECMIAENLQDGLPPQSLPNDPPKRAYEFLCGLAEYLGIDTTVLRKHLFLKHRLQSQMGVHCIFGLRQREVELEDNSFFVHLDRANNVVMVSAAYQNDYALEDDPAAWPWGTIECALEKIRSELEGTLGDSNYTPVQKLYRVGWVWVPDWNLQRYVLRYKLKLTTSSHSYIALIDKAANYSFYTIDAHDGPLTFRLGHVLGSSWLNFTQVTHEEPLVRPPEQPVHPAPRKILLRDVLEDDGQLAGHYVAIEDRLSRSWPTLADAGLQEQSSHLDRIMVFYHITKMQTYLRQLGLTALDDYRGLNPLHVVLSKNHRTAYVSAENRIYFENLHKDNNEFWTHARNTRTIYHECMHAVTDALARLHRQDLDSADSLRAGQLLQAAAIDEGIADYFACSMVAQEGDLRAEYRRLEQQPSGDVCWAAEGRSLVAGPLDLGVVNRYAPPAAAVNDEEREQLTAAVVYTWCQHWARYLWLLRQQLGAEVADVLIANSIFFLNRWSSFGMGVLALLTADRLLFQNYNRTVILETAKIQTDDVARFYAVNGEQALADAKAAITAPLGLKVKQITNEEAPNKREVHTDESVDDDALVLLDFSPPLAPASAETASAAATQQLDLGNLWTMADGAAEWSKQPL